MAFPESFLEELRRRIGLADLIGRHVRLTRKGREFLGLCPFHGEKTPSFSVNEQKGFFHCFGCGAHGSLFDFMMQIEKITFPEAVERLAAEAGLPVPDDRPRDQAEERRRAGVIEANAAAAAFFARALAAAEGMAARDYLHRREVSPEMISRFRLGFAPEGSTSLRMALRKEGFDDAVLIEAGLVIRPDDPARAPYDRFRDRLMFPIADRRGRIVGFGGRILGKGEPKYLNTPETPAFHKGRLLYALDLAADPARERDQIIVVEGYMDVIGLHAAGYANTVAPLGTALTEDQLRELWRIAREPILCFDPDTAGHRAAGRAAERALAALRSGNGLRFAFLDTGTGDDPDGVARRYPRQFLDRTLSEAMPLSEFLFRMEATGHRLDLAEERAALGERLRTRTAAIADAEVRRAFQGAFGQRLRALRPTTAPEWRKGRRGGDAGRSPFGAEPIAVVTAPPKPTPWPDAEQTLIAIILLHPDFFHRAEDSFASADFADPDLDRLRQTMVTILSGAEPMTPDALADAIDAAGGGETRFRVLDNPVLRHHRRIGPEATSFELAEVWEEATAMLVQAASVAPQTRQTR